MEISMPSKEEWEKMNETLAIIKFQVLRMSEKIDSLQVPIEHIPENLTIKNAAKYIGCSESKIKNMIYKQGLLKPYNVDLSTTVFVSKFDLDNIRHRVKSMRKAEENQ